jgi:SAM-dependent methyltransferase
MSAAAQTSAGDHTRVSDHWGQQFERIRADGSVWINNWLISDHIYRLVSGGSQKYWLNWLMEDYFSNVPAFKSSLSVCCGDGSHELELYKSKKVKFVRGFDISAGAIRQANEKFLRAGAMQDSFLLEVKDANNLDIRDHFDLILSTGALHHVTELENLLDKMHGMLRPNGYFVMLEYVGPNRFQWTPRQCELINGFLAQLDPHYLLDGRSPELVPPPIDEMLAIDPSEAVRAEDIVPLVRERFQVEHEKNFNGTLMHMLYPRLNADLANQGQRDFDSIVRLLLYFEDVLVRGGLLPSDFVFLICRPRAEGAERSQATPSTESEARYVGYLDGCTPTQATGWATDLNRPNNTLFVDIHVNDQRVGRVFCNGLRYDVRAAGFGNGLAGFTYQFPAMCQPRPGNEVRVYVSGTTMLVGSGVVAA